MKEKIITIVLWTIVMSVFFGGLIFYENPQMFSLFGIKDVSLMNAIAILYGGS